MNFRASKVAVGIPVVASAAIVSTIIVLSASMLASPHGHGSPLLRLSSRARHISKRGPTLFVSPSRSLGFWEPGSSGAYRLHHDSELRRYSRRSKLEHVFPGHVSSRHVRVKAGNEVFQQLLFVECGMGCDQHGQNATKAAVRACRNAIEFNSLPGLRSVIPGGKENMKLQVQLGVPVDPSEVDLDQVAKVFPYGQLQPIQVEKGGLLGKSGIALPELGDKNEDMIIVIACVSVGY